MSMSQTVKKLEYIATDSMLPSSCFSSKRPADLFSTEAPPAQGPYSQAVKVDDMLYISGCLPLDVHGEIVGPGDIKKQTEQALANVKAIAEAGKSRVGNIIKTIVSIPGEILRT